MPPSPSLRRSPVGDSRGDSHKRGRSLESGLSFKGRNFESGLSFKERDDDLALFNELQTKESDCFLLQSNDGFEDMLSSKVNSFPDLKLGINIPARGESSDLLNTDGDKNDYEWLLTPPDTPLFPSLDDEPAPANPIHSGRTRSRPISISRSSTMERSQRSSRGSPSPQRMSPSSRSGNSTFLGRPSSAPHSSPVPLRPSTPSRRLSPPPVKPSTPPPRSLTPTSRRGVAGPSGSMAASGGTSPVRTSRGNSTSPKVRAWQSNIPGFSLEAPPNLRTSLDDRRGSYVRGSSPVSRTSRGRQSMSPTATRSISSSHSQERDRLSSHSHSKGSIASSGDDDVDSLQSIPLRVSERPMSRKGASGFSSGRPMAYSKKPTKTMSPSSAPKRSFDSAMRQVDRSKMPQNMFRPLLSSVPSSTFYAGKVTSAHRSMVSRNSSVTTSSNASSDQAIGGANDTEDDGASEYARAPFSDIKDEVFAFEKTDVASEDTGHEGNDALSGFGVPDIGHAVPSDVGQSKESDVHICTVESVAVDVEGGFTEIDTHETLLLCCRCGNQYHPDNVAEREDNICPECKQKELLLSNSSSLVGLETTRTASLPLINASEESHVAPSKLASADTMDITQVAFHELNKLNDVDQVSGLRGSEDSSLSRSVEEESMTTLSEQLITEELTTVHDRSPTTNSLQEMQKCWDKPNRNINAVEGAGISVLLLNRSSSLKGPLIHGRTINSSAISYDDLSYTRDFASSLRSSIGHGSISTTSSTDLTSARQGEIAVQRQFSGKRSDASSKQLSTGSSLSGTSLPVYPSFGHSTSSRDGSCEGSVSNMRHIPVAERPGSPSDQVLAVDIMELQDEVPSVSRVAISLEDKNDIFTSSREIDPSFMADHMVNSGFEAKCQGSLGIDEGCVVEELPKRIGNIEETTFIESSMAVEDTVLDNKVDAVEAAENPIQCSISTMSEIEINDSHPSSPKSQIELVSREEVEDPSSTTHHVAGVKDSSLNITESNRDNEIAEESTVTVEERAGRRTRSLTLEEATDTILFCSSIVHDLAYKAASIAIEKEKENLDPSEGSRPMVTIPEKRSSDRKDHHGVLSSRTPKTHKGKNRRAADTTEAKPPLTENEEKSNEPVVRNVGLPNNGDSMKPPKLESKCNCTIM